MPGFDGSGPMGAGPMTGGRRGLCTGASMPGIRPGYGQGYGGGYGRGMGRRRGMGPGRGRGFYPAYGGAPYPSSYPMGYPESTADEMQRLQADAESMKRSLSAIEKRIAELAQDDSE